jgi:flavin reductase (DIM6/NTAB) family NADH-FMN oxidoreductase RutF
MKKNLGSVLALYPTPLVVIGAMNGSKPTWMLAGHVGIIGHDRIMISMHKIHYTNQFICESKHLSVAIVDETLLPKADYVGTISGKNTDKSEVFAYDLSENNTPIIKDSPLVMDCEVVDNYETDSFDNFICKISETYAEENVIDEKNKIDYNKLKPILFEMPTYSYLKTGEIIGRGTELSKKFKQQNKGE